MNPSENTELRKYAVVYGKVSSRKHKKWKGDGALIIKENGAVLRGEGGELLAKTGCLSKKDLEHLSEDGRLIISGFEVEIQDAVVRHNEERPTSLLRLFKSNTSSNRQFVLPLREGSSLEALGTDCIKGLTLPSGENIGISNRLLHFLRPHQEDGIKFLYERLKDKGGGAILGDEMGLGKTLQTIGLISAFLNPTAQNERILSKAILIVPCSLLKNWQAEFSKWLKDKRSLSTRRAP
ncbi:hypothetical protein AB6A40_002655 [Gnathostoma spinigerum]|uniref:SNF2 N-terminal domain-containing protein n=1 Tax=Gnathostoma spinigerum TaxID=75299 RepID=A0ABD6E9R8_9BILA